MSMHPEWCVEDGNEYLVEYLYSFHIKGNLLDKLLRYWISITPIIEVRLSYLKEQFTIACIIHCGDRIVKRELKKTVKEYRYKRHYEIYQIYLLGYREWSKDKAIKNEAEKWWAELCEFEPTLTTRVGAKDKFINSQLVHLHHSDRGARPIATYEHCKCRMIETKIKTSIIRDRFIQFLTDYRLFYTKCVSRTTFLFLLGIIDTNSILYQFPKEIVTLILTLDV